MEESHPERPASPKSPRVRMTTAEQKELLNKSKQSFGGTSGIENVEMHSSISFNTELFKNLDSISQTGDSRDIAAEFETQ